MTVLYAEREYVHIGSTNSLEFKHSCRQFLDDHGWLWTLFSVALATSREDLSRVRNKLASHLRDEIV